MTLTSRSADSNTTSYKWILVFLQSSVERPCLSRDNNVSFIIEKIKGLTARLDMHTPLSLHGRKLYLLQKSTCGMHVIHLNW